MILNACIGITRRHIGTTWNLAKRVNLEILRRFNEAGIEFAFPTQTIHLAKEGESKRIKEMVWYAVKLLVSAGIIVLISELSKNYLCLPV